MKKEKITSLIRIKIEKILHTNCIQFKKVLISVRNVNVNADISTATVYISFFPEKRKYSMLYKIIEKSNYFRKILGLQIKNKIMRIPRLTFRLDKEV